MRLLIYSLCIMSGLILTAQGLTQTIKGQVVDQQSGAPIIGATVLVDGTSPPLGSITDVDGYYRIADVPIGRHTIIVSFLGFEQAIFPEILVGSGKEVVINASLIESLQQLEEVVITASSQEKGQPQNELSTVSAISISVEETSRYAATFQDPARVALTYAGVQTGGDDLLNEIVIRGNSPKGILWRMEGVEIPNPNHFGETGSSAGGISMLSSNMLANSDFFTGAFTSQYGNATSGIFDLKLRQGNFDKHEHAFQAGLLGVAATSEGPITKGGKASYLVNYRYSTLSLITAMGLDILGDQEEVSFQDLSFKFRIPTKKLGSFSIWGLGGDNSYNYLPALEFGEYDYEDQDQTMGVVGLTNVYYVNKDAFFETVISGSYQNLGYSYDSLRVRTFENEEMIEDQLRLSTFYNHKLSAQNTIRIGAIYSRLGYNLNNDYFDYETQTLQNNLKADGEANFIQGYFNWQYRANEKLTLNTGAHYAHFSLNERTYVEPRLGFRYNSGKSAITGGFGLHSRMESLALYNARQNNEDGTYTQNNLDLGFTRAGHAVVGYERMLGDNLRVKAEAYYQHLFDVPVWGNDTTTNAELLSFSSLNTFSGFTDSDLINEGTGTNYGLELTAEHFLTNGFYFLSTLSIYESLYKGIDGIERNTQFNGNYIFNILGGKEFKVGSSGNNTLGINARVISAGGKRQAPIDLQASREAGYSVYDYSDNYALKLDDYFRLDFGLSYRRNKPNSASVFALNVQNIMGRENEFFRYYSPLQGGIASDTQLGFFPNLSYKVEF